MIWYILTSKILDQNINPRNSITNHKVKNQVMMVTGLLFFSVELPIESNTDNLFQEKKLGFCSNNLLPSLQLVDILHLNQKHEINYKDYKTKSILNSKLCSC